MIFDTSIFAKSTLLVTEAKFLFMLTLRDEVILSGFLLLYPIQD